MLGALGEEGVHACERVADGVEAGDHHQVADVEDLLVGQLLAVDLVGEEPGDQVGRRLGPAALDEVGEVRVHLLPDGVDRSLRLGGVVGGVRVEPFRVQHVAEAQEAGQLVFGESDEPEEDRGGEDVRELVGEVTLAVVDEAVDQRVHAAGDVGLLFVHPLRGEQRVQQLAVLRVPRGIDVERDERPHGAEADVDLRREHLVVPQHVLGVGPVEHEDLAAHLDDAVALQQLQVAALRGREVHHRAVAARSVRR